MVSKGITRRTFVFGSALTAGSLLARRAAARTISPNEKLNTAHIGVGGKGRGHLKFCLSYENVVAACDVDDKASAEGYEWCPDVPKYRDWRVMLDKQKDIDAVVITTPDHTHAIIALAAMELGKHVYVEKPMAHTVHEVRRLTEAARRYGVATQMGNQGHSSDGVRQVCEMIWSGAIGQVREVHCWSDRPLWPVGFSEPLPEKPVPQGVDWDLWLGPVQARPFGGYYDEFVKDGSAPGYMPDAWRGWWAFGSGSLGDMGCHIMDPHNWALHLGAPRAITCVQQEGNTPETGPAKSVIEWEFPEREVDGKKFAPVKLTWYDGKIRPPKPAILPADDPTPVGGEGTIFVGESGVLTCDAHGNSARLRPDSLMADYTMPSPTLERLPWKDNRYDEAHRANWIQACKGGKPAVSNFDYAGPFTETVQLGNVAVRVGGRIEWDSAACKIVNNSEADTLVRATYRKGWEF